MNAHDEALRIPKGALIAAAIVIAITICLAYFARVTGYGRSVRDMATAVESRTLAFEDRADGAVVVRDARARNVIDVLTPGTYGFVRVAMRGMARDRKFAEIGAEPPFVLTRWSDNRVTLDDTATGRRMDLAAFGRNNVESFSRLLSKTGQEVSQVVHPDSRKESAQ